MRESEGRIGLADLTRRANLSTPAGAHAALVSTRGLDLRPRH